jgi:hypothetical protein
VVESKASWLTDSVLWERDASKYLQLLRQKYGVTQNDIKGVGQLAKSILKLFKGKDCIPEDGSLLHCNSIYPILAVYDDYLGAGDHAAFFAKEFYCYLCSQTDGIPQNFEIGTRTVHPLIVMGVSAIEVLEIISRRRSVLRVLDEYYDKICEHPGPFENHLLEYL